MQEGDDVIPLVEERARVEKREVETGRVVVRTHVREEQVWVRDALARDEVTVERVPVGREIADLPEVRQEGDVTIVPVVEEIVIVEKRLLLKEELHITRRRRSEPFAQEVTLKIEEAEIERTDTDRS